MTEQLDPRLDAALRSMLLWEDNAPHVWEKALAAEGPMPRRPVVKSYPRILAAAAMLLMCALVVGAFLPSLGRARSAARSVAPSEQVMADRHDFGAAFDASGGQDWRFAARTPISESANIWRAPLVDWSGISRPAAPEPTTRIVERRATLELEVEDSRAAYVKARALVSEARGEFVQGGRIVEQGDRHRADLVLRVQVSRLDEVLDALRSLGTVKDERLDAADVTEQMVDLEARLANEGRIETELLDLLDKRPNDTLEDILRVRTELGGVRERIERLVAQRSKLASLVALSTITLVITEHSDKPATQPEKTGLWGTFKHDVATAWHDGARSLLRFVAWLVEAAIAGLPLWLITGTAVFFVWRSYRRHHPRRLPV
ncbi:MAG: DUF4349 domain-containing protein [Phycisphaerales bacterium]|nr:DUF4349 domain-containing protein [Phycisphaerales bacterium]